MLPIVQIQPLSSFHVLQSQDGTSIENCDMQPTAFIGAVCQCLYLFVQDDDVVVSSSPTRRARMRSSLEMDAYPSHISDYDEYSQYGFIVALCQRRLFLHPLDFVLTHCILLGF